MRVSASRREIQIDRMRPQEEEEEEEGERLN